MLKWKEESVHQLGKLHSYFKNCYNHSSLQQPTSLIKLRQDRQYWGKTLNQQKGCNLLNDNGYHLLIMKFFKVYTVSTEKKMAPYSSTLAWKIPWTEEPGRPAVHGVAKSQTGLSDFTFTFHFHALEKETATHSSVLAWRIPETGEPGGLLSMGSHSWTWLKRLSSSTLFLRHNAVTHLIHFSIL